MKNYFFLLFLLFTSMTLMAQTKMKSGSISIFKNGTYFTLQQGNAKPLNKNFTVLVPDNPLYGTIWLGVGKDNKIDYISVKQDTIKSKHEAKSIQELLKANLHKMAKIYVNVGGNNPINIISGEVEDVYTDYQTLKVKNGDKITMIGLNNIMQVDIEGGANDKFEIDSIARIAKIYLDKNIAEIPVNMIYMQHGINWVPAYAIKILDDKNAKLEMKATLENSVENIQNCEVNLVVGNPQMFYGSQIDPIALGLQPGVNSSLAYDYRAMQQMNAAPAYGYAKAEEERVVFNQESFTTNGDKEQDLYYYRLGSINLEKDSKTIVPISSSNITYKDIYEVDIYDYTMYYNNRAIYPDPQRKFEVYHKLRFDNTTGSPLTTASVFVINEKEEPLAQDQLEYAPTGAEVDVRLSKAIDVLIKSEEEEKDRMDNVKKINKVNYGKVILKGEIEIANFQDKKIKLNTKKTINGDVLNQSDNAKVVKQKQSYNSYINPISMISWEIELAPGEKKTLTYEYEVLVPMIY